MPETAIVENIDYSKDEPTQFMLQLFETSIKRNIERRKNRFTKVFSTIASPWGMVMFLLFACPGLATVFTLTTISYSYSGNIFRQFGEILGMLLLVVTGIFSFRLFTIAVIPVPIKSGLLDINFQERVMLSGIIGADAWRYLTHKLELEYPIKYLKTYLSYIVITLAVFLNAFFLFDYFNRDYHDILENIVRTTVLTVVILSLLINGMRIVLALKHIVYNLKWSIFAQQLIAFTWIIGWGVIGFIGKFFLTGQDPYWFFGFSHELDNLLTVFHTLVVFSIFILSIVVLIKTFKNTSNSIYMSLLSHIKHFFPLYILTLILLLRIIGIWKHYILVAMGRKPFDLLVLDPYLQFIIVLVAVAYGLRYYLGNKNYQKVISNKYLGRYMFYSTLLIVLLILMYFFGLHLTRIAGIAAFSLNFLMVVFTMPSLFIIYDKSLLDVLEHPFNFQLHSYVIIWLLAYKFPSIFAQFMEILAFRPPAKPRI